MFDVIKKNILLRWAQKSHYQLTAWLFLRCLGVVYFVAFYSLSTQIIGLWGEHGILPANDFLVLIAKHFGQLSFFLFPTIFWINVSDAVLMLACLVGCVLSILVVLGMGTGLSLLLLWVLYLSFVNIGQDFLSFQWDILLLEAGFLSIFLAPWQWLEIPWKINWGGIQWKAPPVHPPLVIIWLLRWLLFRLMFESGLVKLASGDINWRHLNALDYHYLTQPLPTPIAWYLAKLPHWLNETCVIGMFIVELLVPFLIFAGGKGRLTAAFILALFQIIIAMAGNYAFFNLLTIVLCICLLDDQFLDKTLPWLRHRLLSGEKSQKQEKAPRLLQKAVSYSVAVLIAILSICGLSSNYFLCNSYGLFAIMTTQRLEIQIEGSNDGQNWQEYEFKCKPGNLSTAPCMVAPCQPRLDWQMWFAALGEAQNNPWFINFVFRLLQGEKEVLALLANNPFPHGAPKYLRARLYDYHFTKAREREITGNWWKRELVGEYFGTASLE